LSGYRFAILATAEGFTRRHWVEACRRHGVDHHIVDIVKQDWLERIVDGRFDCLLIRPDARLSRTKELYDERLYILSEVLGQRLYPTYPELRIYENKRLLAYWLKANGVPHPATYVFYDPLDADAFLSGCAFPIVAKSRLGAAGSGVRLLRSEPEARAYVGRAFSWRGTRRRFGPNLRQPGLVARSRKGFSFEKLRDRLSAYMSRYMDAERGYVILQDYVPHDFEWRVVRIGPSYFAHKKVAASGFASGTKMKVYDDPPIDVLEFVRSLCERHAFVSQAVDILPSPDGALLVNELQAIFGQSDPFQMKVDGRIGRYLLEDGAWRFQPGDFTDNECFDLRVEHAIALLDAERSGGTSRTRLPPAFISYP
jgi:hypothetical protein